MIKKVTSILLSLCLVLSIVSFGTSAAYASTTSSGETVYVLQDGRGKCTLASAVMMVRKTAINQGATDWQSITQSSMKSAAWIEGQGLRHSFSFRGITVSYKDMAAGDKKSQLISLLKAHPEGIEIYLRSVPHAVLLTRYDASTGIFYCADPALSVYEMQLDKSWLRKVKTNATQADIINAIDCYWYVASAAYTGSKSATPVSVTPAVSGSTSTSSSTTTPATSGSVSSVGSTAVSSNTATVDDESISADAVTSSPVIQLSKVKSYVATTFKDVPSYAWYASYVKTSFELGLMGGTLGYYNPDGYMTLAQAITIAARIHNSYNGNAAAFTASEGQEWHQPYITYAYQYGIIDDSYKSKNMTANASRLEFAEILTNSLPDSVYPELNNVATGSISDVSSTSAAGKAIYKLYRAGVLTGSEDGKFHPADPITRAAASAIVARIADSTQRVAS